ncbi:MAG: chemotaxis protein CheC [Clostridiales bacterium GWE2_32_10]|nr:MAG: chemotaxis protein CheC [Clostridiales bacterium GWE2_32_10]HBY20036.1 chemotaxis protein CheX [Clostridiales bacterium]
MSVNVKYINPFIEAAQSVLKDMCQQDLKIGKIYLKASPYASSEVVVNIGVTGDIKGQVLFSISKDVACSIASKMMGGMEVKELDELSKSAVQELTNMILGSTATIFYNRGISIDITPPCLLIAQDIKISISDMKIISIPLEFIPTGETFEIDVGIRE